MKPSPMPFQSLILSQPSPIIFNSDPTVHGLIRITTADYPYCVRDRRTIQTIDIHPLSKFRSVINQSYPSYQIHCDRVHQRKKRAPGAMQYIFSCKTHATKGETK
eukprot:39012_1